MDSQQLTAMHEQALTLAESGRYDQALGVLNDYLSYRPQDGQAINDAATILFCLGKGPQAIALYEKACRFCSDEQLAQVQWNLCEAYLQEGRAAQAIGLFDQMDARGLLNVDMLHRAADCLLKKDLLGPAVELLLRSLQMNPEQDILKSMIDVIRSHRARTAVVIRNKGPLAHQMIDELQIRLPLTVLDTSSHEAASIPPDTDIALFFGCGQTLVRASRQPCSMRLIVILDTQDLAVPEIRSVNWQNVQSVLMFGRQQEAQRFYEHIEHVPSSLTVLTAEPIVNPHQIAFQTRKKGKRIAALGPWDARQNPMFALMCFQKLHYLDPDARLYIGGVFIDQAVEHYIRHLIETLELDNVVFLDGPISDMKKWLRDKHYLLSTAIDDAAMGNVWLAMGYGLRPLVHRFPGVERRLDEAYVFTLAEDFCRIILHGPYDAAAHRSCAERVYQEHGLEHSVMDQIFRAEQELHIAGRQRMAASSLPFESTYKSSVSVIDKAKTAYYPSIDQIAGAALAATQPCRDLSSEPLIDEEDMSLKPIVQNASAAAEDSAVSSPDKGLSVEQLTEIRRNTMHRRRKNQTSQV
jgi:tetratricopeptide (TPR) repeat protein